jgi:hypothetical protein
MKFHRWVAAFGFLTGFHDAAEIPFPEVLEKAAVVQENITDINREGLVIGNGDLSGILWQRDGGLCLRVTKNDVWDARVDTSRDPALMTVDIPNQKWNGGTSSPHSYQTPYPQPRCPALIRIGGSGPGTGWSVIRAGGKNQEWVLKDGLGTMAVEGDGVVSTGYRYTVGKAMEGRFDRLSFRISGTANAQYYVNIYDSSGKALVESGWKDSPATETGISFPITAAGAVGAIELYVQSTNGSRAENRIRQLVLTSATTPLAIPAGMPAALAGGNRLDLRRAVATVGGTTVRALAGGNVFLIETDEAVTIEEIKAAELPAAEHGETEGIRWLHAKLPGDADYAGMQYAMAVAAAGKSKAVSLVTSWETKGDVREAAIALARRTVNGAIPELIAGHEAEWSRFWSASGVDLGDPDFQLWWYRMAYFLRCFSKPGVNPAGLWGVLPNDTPQWHGDYHHNYNAWQPFWSAMILNQPGLAEPWIDYMNRMLPRLRWLAKTTYGCEGAFVGISSFAFEPDPAACTSVNKRQSMLTPWGYTMGMIGMSAQVLWHHHLYQPDREYLETKIWPVMREAALFFASFAEKCPRDGAGKAVYGPSYSPEHGGFGVSNVPFDLAYARFTLGAAIRAAGELGENPDLAKRLRAALDILPAYPTAPDAQGRPVVVDWTGCGFGEIKEHNITVPAVPVFPGEQVTWFSPGPEKELFLNTLRQIRHRGANSTVMLSVAKARLSMPEAPGELRDYYRPHAQPNGMFYWPLHGFYLSESVGIAAAISEFLLQSVDDTIRVFPCWPKDKDARFRNLRAQGGFLVSAEQTGGTVTMLEITPTVDGRLRMVDPWTGRTTEQDAVAGKTLRFTPKQALPTRMDPDKRVP